MGVMVSRAVWEEHMADEEQLRSLQQGGITWKAWREQAGEDVLIDLSGANLAH